MATSPGRQTAVVAAVATSTTSATIIAASAAGAARIIVNDSLVVLYLRFGSVAAVSTDFSVSLAAGASYYAPDNAYSGAIQGILASSTGFARVTSW